MIRFVGRLWADFDPSVIVDGMHVPSRTRGQALSAGVGDVWTRSSRGEAVEFFPLDDTAGNAANHFMRLVAALDVGWFVNRCKAFADPASFLEPLKCHLVKSQEVDSKKARSHPCLSFSRRMRKTYELPQLHCRPI